MNKSYLCGVLIGIAFLNMLNATRGLIIAIRDNDRVSMALACTSLAIGEINLAILIPQLLKIVFQGGQ